MRFTVNVECSPEEARAFFGFPDVGPTQEVLMKELQEQMVANIKQMDPQKLMQQWLPMSLQAFEQFQKMFWSHMGQAMPGQNSESSRKRG